MSNSRAIRLDRAVDPSRDHVLGDPAAEITLVEYGSYVCPYCHAAHEVIGELRDRFGDRMRYVFRQLPLRARENGVETAQLAEYAGETADRFWEVHDALMRGGPSFAAGELEAIAAEFDIPVADLDRDASERAAGRVEEDTESARRSGAWSTPTFFINGRRYEGPWDETALAEAMLGSLGHRLHAATVDFVRWAPSTGLLLLLMSVLAVVITNSPLGEAFTAFWESPFGLRFGAGRFELPLIDWVNDGLLAVFFLVVGLEIKRELTVGRLANRRAAALPVAASLGGMIAPALIYLLFIPPGPLVHGWGTTIATDTAFAIAIIVLLGDRVPIDLRVFLTAAVIVDDLVAIVIVAVFYSGALHLSYLTAAAVVTVLLALLNRVNVYRALPYALLGVVLWLFLHEAGLHATLAGVILAVVTPTRPPPNLYALMEQAQMVMDAETRAGEGVMRHGPSEPAIQAIDAIHDRVESPANKLLRSIEPWSSYVVLPVFALANAGVAWSPGIADGRMLLMAAIIFGLVVGKPTGIVLAAWLAVRFRIATKPSTYNWRQLAGAGVLAGIGFTMALFIAGQAFRGADYIAAKVAIFLASIAAGTIGTAILWRRPRSRSGDERAESLASRAISPLAS